ncbi:hypothetical protein [Sorangium sp. So ce362]|uniref:hypothetical protein n=1 Tax=Sorangium sp. So ce362 TaxID=3133303 RepID=UPI003F63DD2F
MFLIASDNARGYANEYGVCKAEFFDAMIGRVTGYEHGSTCDAHRDARGQARDCANGCAGNHAGHFC